MLQCQTGANMCILIHFGMETKNENIELLLSNLRELENSISRIKATDSFSFTFFRQSFKQMQEMMRLLHELEFLHVEEMKKQMENLVLLLSENSENDKQTDLHTDTIAEVEEKNEEEGDEKEIPENFSTEPSGNIYAQGVSLPDYVNPRFTESAEKDNEVIETEKISTTISVNDIINHETIATQSKKGFSLNDRFLFQRELFNNSRDEMNEMMHKLKEFDNFTDAEQYLKENTSWVFENEVVESFMQAIKVDFGKHTT